MSAVCLHFSPGEAVDLQGQPQGPRLKFVDFVVERNSIEVIFLELAIRILEVILEALYLKNYFNLYRVLQLKKYRPGQPDWEFILWIFHTMKMLL